MSQMLGKVLGFIVFSALVLVACSGTGAARHAEIAAKGAMVMPFDLERTTHIFEKQALGGLQQVISDDGDSEQVMLIREHLKEEAERFQKGDFHDPAMIHGENMAGLHELTTRSGELTIAYAELAEGGQITYTAEDPELIAAIHAWFEQQLADHGSHAQSGH